MSTNVSQSRDSLQSELKTKQICRFCLTQQSEKLGSIYSRDGRIKSSAPLPVQVMACASIEVFSNDGMPSYVCNDCRLLFEHSYRFKQMCKRADTLLRQYPLTGQWPVALAKPKIPQELLPARAPQSIGPIITTVSSFPMKSTPTKKPIEGFPKKILNSDPADSPEPPVPMRMKKEKLDEETTIFLNKMENNEELSMDDVQRLIAAANEEHNEMTNDEPNVTESPQKTPKPRPKLLNKSSIRILNKNAEVVVEPRLSAPQLKRDVDGKVAMVTEILDPNTSYDAESEPDRIKNATPVETVVFPCPHCERSFPLRQLRDIHMVNHTRSRRFQCPECDKSFFSKYDLQKHNLMHTGDRPYKCTACDKAFTRATLLHRHEKTHTDIPKFICIHCEKPFISKEQMEKHAERHLKNRPYQCQVCNKSFAFKQGLERHEVIHSREQPYPCQYCEQSFSTPSKLARHLTAHAGKRPYPCKFCSKSYLLSHHLTRHMRSHKNGVVSFMCGDCDKVFKSRDELIYHSAVHATQTLVCPLCKENFQDIQSVTVHIKEHAEGEAYACEFCDLIFMTAERLQQHTDKDHVNDMVAYHEDEQSRPTNKNQEESNNMKGLEETIEEFLVDELPDDAHILSDQKLVSVQSKGETKGDNFDENTEIISEIVLDPKENYSFEDNTMLDENNEDIESRNIEREQAPSKIRKVISSNSKRVIKVGQQPSITSTQLRRKVASTSGNIEKTKSEKGDQNESKATPKAAINSVLKLLPKGVSVRRNAPNNESTTTTQGGSTEKQTKPLQSKIQQVQTRTSTRLSSESAAKAIKKPEPISSTTNSQELPSKRLSTAKSPSSSSAVTSSNQNTQKNTVVGKLTQNATSPQLSPGKTVKMMLGDKKVKVQKITITKAEAAAMAKDGRIRMKDGAMILTKPTK